MEYDLACSSRAAIGDADGGNCLRPWAVLAEPGDREAAHARQSLEYLHLIRLGIEIAVVGHEEYGELDPDWVEYFFGRRRVGRR